MSQPVFKNPFVSAAPVLAGVGNGTLTVDRLTHFTITQTYTAICTAIAPFTVFKIIGSLDGPVAVAQVGVQCSDPDLKFFLTINQGPTLFAIGDTFTFTVTQGVDLNQENIDTYDALPQKNFSAGLPNTVGQLAGDDNLRFRAIGMLAAAQIQNLKLVSKLLDELGNDISIEYIDASTPAFAALTLQDILYQAQTVGTPGNAISVEYEDWTPGVFAQLTLQNLKFFANTVGTPGNSIQVKYVPGGTATLEGVSVVGSNITVTIEDGVSTAKNIRTAINNSPAASALVGVGWNTNANQNDPQTADSTFHPLTGGINPIGASGAEVVTVVGNAIKVKLQSGVSTATQVKAAVDGYPAAAALVSTAITGVGAHTQAAPVAATFLSGGSNSVAPPGAEIVVVTNKKISVTFQSGQSTAAQLKAAIEANVDANALVTVTVDAGQNSTVQTAPLAETFLSGGAPDENYCFNVNELSDVPGFHDGNGNVVVNHFIAHGRLYVREGAKFSGVVKLDDLSGASGDAVDNAQLTINQLIDESRSFLAGGGTLSHDASIIGKVSWSADLLARPIGKTITITVPAGNITLADDEVAYIQLDTLFASGVKTLQKASRTSAGMRSLDRFWVFYRAASQIIVRGGLTLVQNEERTLGNSLSDDTFTFIGSTGETDRTPVYSDKVTTPLNDPISNTFVLDGDSLTKTAKKIDYTIAAFFGQLRLKPMSPVSTRVKVTGANTELLDQTILGQELSQYLISFAGAEIDFATGIVYADDGVTVLGSNFTPPVLSADRYFWYGITAVADLVTADNQLTLKMSVALAAADGPSPTAAAKPKFNKGKNIGMVVVKGNGVSIDPLDTDNIVQLGVGGGGGSGTGALVGRQEPLAGIADGVNDTFGPMTFTPITPESIIVMIDFIPVPISGWSQVGASIQFTSLWLPRPGQSVYVYYLSEGDAAVAGVPNGIQKVEYRTITSLEVTNKKLTLIATPALNTNTMLDVCEGGGAQIYGVDFIVNANELDWSGRGLDGVLAAGDKVRINYIT